MGYKPPPHPVDKEDHLKEAKRLLDIAQKKLENLSHKNRNEDMPVIYEISRGDDCGSTTALSFAYQPLTPTKRPRTKKRLLGCKKSEFFELPFPQPIDYEPTPPDQWVENWKRRIQKIFFPARYRAELEQSAREWRDYISLTERKEKESEK